VKSVLKAEHGSVRRILRNRGAGYLFMLCRRNEAM
jgi:hypothetical protein